MSIKNFLSSLKYVKVDNKAFACTSFFAQRGTTPTEAVDKTNNQPHIVCFQDDEEELAGQYFISVEQTLMMESSNLVAALFFLSLYFQCAIPPQGQRSDDLCLGEGVSPSYNQIQKGTIHSFTCQWHS